MHEPYRVPRPTARAFSPQSKGELKTALQTCFQDISLKDDPYDAARWRPAVPLYDKYARALHDNKYAIPLYDDKYARALHDDKYARALHDDKYAIPLYDDTYAVHDAGTATLFHTTTSTTPAATPTVVVTDWVSPGSIAVGTMFTLIAVFVFITLAAMAACFSIHRKTTVKKGSPPIAPDHTDPPETVKENKRNNSEYEHPTH